MDVCAMAAAALQGRLEQRASAIMAAARRLRLAEECCAMVLVVEGFRPPPRRLETVLF